MSLLPRVFVSHPSDRLDAYYGQRALQALRAVAEVRLNVEPRELSTDELVVAARGCDALIAYRQTPAPRALFAALPELKAFLRCAMDIRSVDVDAASAHGVLVTRASPGFNPAVAEWIVGMMIVLGRGHSRYASAYHRGETPTAFMGRQLHGSTLGIVGFGGIGQALGRLALALGMEVRVTTPEPVAPGSGVTQVPMSELLAGSDFVACLAPALPETARLFDATAFAVMRPGAFFVNASRGELVDEAALLAALDAGTLAGCALDVGMAADQMPSLELARHPRVLATPHIGGLTPPATEHQALETVAQLTALLHGRIPEGAVNARHATRLEAWATGPEKAHHHDIRTLGRPAMTDLPSGACDCHVHIYAPGHALAPTATFVPPHAPVADYREVQRAVGLQRVIVVQPTGYGFDNACAEEAIAQFGEGARGVAVVPPEVGDDELDRLHAAGFRGVRFMMLGGGVLPWSALPALAAQLAERDWHVNLQLDGRDLPLHEAVLSSLPCRLVIDHLGKFLEPVAPDHPSFAALRRVLDRGRTWIKLSAPYETSRTGAPAYADVAALAAVLASAHAERCLWASNWPHPNVVPRPDESALLDWTLALRADDGWCRQVMVDNPAALYGFAAPG